MLAAEGGGSTVVQRMCIACGEPIVLADRLPPSARHSINGYCDHCVNKTKTWPHNRAKRCVASKSGQHASISPSARCIIALATKWRAAPRSSLSAGNITRSNNPLPSSDQGAVISRPTRCCDDNFQRRMIGLQPRGHNRELALRPWPLLRGLSLFVDCGEICCNRPLLREILQWNEIVSALRGRLHSEQSKISARLARGTSAGPITFQSGTRRLFSGVTSLFRIMLSAAM